MVTPDLMVNRYRVLRAAYDLLGGEPNPGTEATKPALAERSGLDEAAVRSAVRWLVDHGMLSTRGIAGRVVLTRAGADSIEAGEMSPPFGPAKAVGVAPSSRAPTYDNGNDVTPLLRIEDDPEFEGNRQHPNHEQWLLALGRATHQAGMVAVVAFDMLRLFGGYVDDDLVRDPLGELIRKLKTVKPEVPELEDFLTSMDAACTQRNHLLHALPVANGLHRRRPGKRSITFFTIASLDEARAVMAKASRHGNRLNHHNDGAAIREWYEAGAARRGRA